MSKKLLIEGLYALITRGEGVEVINKPCIEVSESEITGFSPGCPPGAPRIPMVLMPGLCNAHVHLLDYSIAEIGEDYRLEDLVELPRGLKYKALAGLSTRALRERLASLAEKITGHGTLYIGAYAELGSKGAALVREVFEGRGVFARILAQPLKKEYTEYLGLLERFGGTGLDTLFDLEPMLLRRLVSRANEVNSQVHVHVSETKSLYEQGDYRLALEVRPHVAIHLTVLGPGEILELARNGIGLVFCPRSNMFHSGMLPRVDVLPMVLEETNVGLGTDNAAWITPFIAEEAAYSYISIHAALRTRVRRIAEAILLSITSSCVKLLNLWRKGYDELEDGVTVSMIPEIAWSSDPLITLVKRMSSYPLLGIPPGQAAGVFGKLLGENSY